MTVRDECQEKMKRYDRNMFMENSVDSAQALAYNDIETESLLRKWKGAMHSTKGGMPT